jgi:hypothetical protein
LGFRFLSFFLRAGFGTSAWYSIIVSFSRGYQGML